MRPQSLCNLRNHQREVDDLLRRECDKVRMELGEQLEAAKQEVAHQKYIKEDVIKKEKAARAELERLKRCCDPETLNINRFATVVRSTLKTKKKKVLQKEYEDLKVALMISQEKSAAELQILKERNTALQQELDQLKASPATEELLAEKDALIQTLQENASVTERRFSKQVEEVEELKAQLHCAESLSGCQEERIKQLTTDLEREKESCQMQVLNLMNMTLLLQEEVSALQFQVWELTAANVASEVKHSAVIQVLEETKDQEVNESLSIEALEKPPEPPLDAVQELHLILDALPMRPTLGARRKCVEMSFVPLPTIEERRVAEVLESYEGYGVKKPSRWKRFRHFIGLRKRNKGKNVEKST